MTVRPMSDDAAVGALQAAVRIPTVSHRDKAQDDREAFDDFIRELADRFPLLHHACEVTRLAGDALLMHWPGRDPSARPVVLMAHIDVVPIGAADIRCQHTDAGIGQAGHSTASTWFGCRWRYPSSTAGQPARNVEPAAPQAFWSAPCNSG